MIYNAPWTVPEISVDSGVIDWGFTTFQMDDKSYITRTNINGGYYFGVRSI